MNKYNRLIIKYYKIYSTEAQGLVEKDLPREFPFQRLPQQHKDDLRKEVWDLSQNSAGVSVSFTTDSPELQVKWSIMNDLRMNHMTDVGIKGIDLYQKRNGAWHYLSTGIPTGKDNEQFLFRELSKESREYRLHLPLYDTVTSLKIGIDDGSRFEIIKNKNKPIIFYGTSITQGGCASRPGIAYTNIISRSLGIECINLGFSGNGHLELAVANIISESKAKLYVIECMANVDLDMIRKNTMPLIECIRSNKSSQTQHIVFCEEAINDKWHPDKVSIESKNRKNIELHKQVKDAKSKGYDNLHIISQVGLIDEDTEATVDGVHYNDLGFERHAKHLIRSLQELGLL